MTGNTERDELARLIDDQWGVFGLVPSKVADALIDAGYRRPDSAVRAALHEAADLVEQNNDHILCCSSGGYSAGFHYALECIRSVTREELADAWDRVVEYERNKGDRLLDTSNGNPYRKATEGGADD